MSAPRSTPAVPPTSTRRIMRHRGRGAAGCRDRKSTRLNSSHLGRAYAVFCFKKQERVDGSLARTFARELNRELMNDRPPIVVDLSHVKKIDSHPLNTLIDCMVGVAARDGAVT